MNRQLAIKVAYILHDETICFMRMILIISPHVPLARTLCCVTLAPPPASILCVPRSD